MYRIPVIVLIIGQQILAAPQDNSDITYVKIQPLKSSSVQPAITKFRESRIENIPLQIKSYSIPDPETDTLHNSAEVNRKSRSDERDQESEYVEDKNEFLQENDNSSTNTNKTPQETTTEIDKPPVSLLPISQPFDKIILPRPRFFSKLNYFSTQNDVAESPLTTNFISSRDRNLLGIKKFKSRCRCERIWNCPKLQITVPRCPDEYFLCCF